MAYNKNNIDKQSEAEANALAKQNRREFPRRLRYETGSYNEIEFNKLFKIDKLHSKKIN